MAFPTVSVIDTFDRADENPLAGWTSPLYSGFGSAFKVEYNEATGAGPSPNAYRTAETIGPDLQVYMTIAGAGSSSNQITLSGRIANAGGSVDDYHVRFNRSGDVVTIERADSGANTTLGANMSHTLANGHKIGLEIVGTSISAYVDSGSGWVLLGTRTDSTHTAAGKVGLYAADEGTYIDDFAAGTVASATVRQLASAGVGT